MRSRRVIEKLAENPIRPGTIQRHLPSSRTTTGAVSTEQIEPCDLDKSFQAIADSLFANSQDTPVLGNSLIRLLATVYVCHLKGSLSSSLHLCGQFPRILPCAFFYRRCGKAFASSRLMRSCGLPPCLVTVSVAQQHEVRRC